ncbi:MAG TPA: hypothetical protein O0X50_04255, partial [Methanocorpusculum sp.]|nr:hypothetical protein [Methanocorpusculum sp.]
IILIYSLIPVGMQLLTRSLGIAGIIISLVIFILFLFILIPGLVNYARKQTFISAFMFPEMIARVRAMTWERFVLALLFFIIVDLLIFLILYFLLTQIPFIGWIVTIVVVVPLNLFQAKFWSDVFL